MFIAISWIDPLCADPNIPPTWTCDCAPVCVHVSLFAWTKVSQRPALACASNMIATTLSICQHNCVSKSMSKPNREPSAFNALPLAHSPIPPLPGISISARKHAASIPSTLASMCVTILCRLNWGLKRCRWIDFVKHLELVTVRCSYLDSWA